MKRIYLIIAIFACVSTIGNAQEICDNAIDDDGDGLVDLNDDECGCSYLIDLSLIPNPSFEESLCCPFEESMLACATSWTQASAATSDYFNFCDYTTPIIGGALPAAAPIPGGGSGFIGLYNFLGAYREYAGACTSGPLLAGVSYTLNFHTAYAFGDVDFLDLQFYGSPNCGDLPWFGIGCPEGIGGWELLASELVEYTMDGEWISVTITFTPATNMNAIAFGASCSDLWGTDASYFYFDELILVETEISGEITSSGGWCSGDLELTAVSDFLAGTWQWYKDGVTLVGETSNVLSPIGFGEGLFTARYSFIGGCLTIDYESPYIPEADFAATDVCLGNSVPFTNLTTDELSDGVTFLWDFGDGTTINFRDPTHTYLTSGIFNVELIAYSSDPSCNDTAFSTVTILDKPNPDFELSGIGVSTTGIDWLACANDEINFTDLTTIDGPISFESWFWDFGDGGTSAVQNPVYTYSESGNFVMKLVVVAENGCTDSVEFEIILTEIVADFVTDTACFGEVTSFTDSSFVSDVSGVIAWDWIFELDSLSEFPNPTYTFGNDGIFMVQLKVANIQGCIDSVVKPVRVAAIPNPNFYADFNPTDYFHTDLNLIMIYPNPTSNYSWEMPDGIPSFSTEYGSTRVKYPEFEVGTYEVTLTEYSSFGCENTVAHLIQVLEDEMLFAPTAFTPNGDPYNPDWGVHVEGFLTGEFSLMVFNQWGEIVWQTTDPTARWDGTYLNGVLAPSDLYVWYLKARDQINDEIFEFTGYVTLNR